MPVLLGYPVQIVSQRVYFARHGHLHDEFLLLAGHILEVYAMLDEARIEGFKCLGIRCVHKQAVYLNGKIVPGGAENRPTVRKLLGFEEYFFPDYVERLVGWICGNNPVILFPYGCFPVFLFIARRLPRLEGAAVHPNETGRLKSPEIIFRILQSIGMVNPQAGDLSCLQPA